MKGAPQLSKEFFCIVDRDNVQLAAVVSSYLAAEGVYIPFFEYPTTTVEKVMGDDTARDRHEMSRRRAYLFGVMVNNAFAQMDGAENLILAGLSVEQKSFLTLKYPRVNIIEIPDIQTAEASLAAFSGDKKIMRCRQEDVLYGLHVALKYGLVLRMDALAEPIISVPDEGDGLVMIETIPAVGSVIAVNYAGAVGANIRLMEQLEDGEVDEIKYCMDQWKGDRRGGGDGEAERKILEEKVNSRVVDIDFSRYRYCTFFTCGLPYSVVLGNITRFSYVNMIWNMDRFVMNAILTERERRVWSGVVFSPQNFGEFEETTTVISALTARRYFIKPLLGREATAFNLQSHVVDYPYDVLHICSHGGDVEGEYCSHELVDDKGTSHTMEFDLVRSFHPGGPGKFVPIPTKFYWQAYDGEAWGSPRYRAAGGIDPELFVRLRSELEERSHKGRLHGDVHHVPNSSCVRCWDFPFLGMFDVCAAGKLSPFVFNNSCWSGYEMAEPFVEGGARGYIGTFWPVNTVVATEVGQEFYQEVFGSTILEAFHKAIQKTAGKKDQDVYIFWGLHFSTLTEGDDSNKVRERLVRWLGQEYAAWLKKAMYHINKEVRVNSFRKARWIRQYVLQEFGVDVSWLVRFVVEKG